MSFFRPEAVAAVRRWGEPALYAVVLFGGGWYGFALLNQGGWVGVVVLAIAAFAGLALFHAVERSIVAWRGRAQGPGVVAVQEGRISYFGPQGGAVLALDALVLIEIVTSDGGPFEVDLHWVLQDEIGQIIAIPGGAAGTQDLLDRLGSLPGFDHIAVISAMGSTQSGRFRLWRRASYVGSS